MEMKEKIYQDEGRVVRRRWRMMEEEEGKSIIS